MILFRTERVSTRHSGGPNPKGDLLEPKPETTSNDTQLLINGDSLKKVDHEDVVEVKEPTPEDVQTVCFSYFHFNSVIDATFRLNPSSRLQNQNKSKSRTPSPWKMQRPPRKTLRNQRLLFLLSRAWQNQKRL